MFKSALRLIKYPLLPESMLATGAVICNRLNLITSRSICTSSLCNKEIRTQSDKTRVGKSSKYGFLEGESTPELTNFNQQ